MTQYSDNDQRRLLAGLLAGDVALLDEIGTRVPAEALAAHDVGPLYRHMIDYRKRTGGIITRDALTGVAGDAGSAALLGEVFDAVQVDDAPDAAGTRWAADAVVKTHRRSALVRLMAETSDVLNGRVVEELPGGRPGRTWSGVDDAGAWLTARLSEWAALGTPGATPIGTRRMRATSAADVVARRVRWLWDRRIVLGGLTLLAGREGLGKSTVAVDLAANVTRGTLLGECHGTPRTVLYVATEDSHEFTVKPRLIAAGADLSRLIFPDMVTVTADGEAVAPIVLPTDVTALADLVTEHDAALVVLDAATSTIDGKLDGDRDRQMRQGLEAIARGVAERTGCAVVGIVHFGKRETADTGKLILGSIAWSQVARSVLAVARDDETGDLIVTAAKTNLGAPAPSVGARLVGAEVETDDGTTSVSRVEWTGETDRDARDLLSGDRTSAEERDDRDEAVSFIRTVLADAPNGEMGAAEVISAAERAGIAKHTVQRARKRSGATTRKASMGSGWVWALNTNSDDVPDGDPGTAEDDSRGPEDDEGDKVTRAHENAPPSSSSVSPSGVVSSSAAMPPTPVVTQSDYGSGVETDPELAAILAGSRMPTPVGEAS